MTKSRDLRDARCAYKSLRNGRALVIRDQSNTKLVINTEHKWMRPHCRIFVIRLYPLYTRLKLHAWVVAKFITTLFTCGNNIRAYSRNTPLKLTHSLTHSHATLNNISVISWLSVLMVEEIGVSGESLTNFIT